MQINEISCYLPSNKITNKFLSEKFGISEEEIFKRTGVLERRHTHPDFVMEDMAFEAAKNLLDKNPELYSKIDGLLLIGHGFSYKAPNTSAILQHRLQLSNNCYCLDLPHGCSGYMYGLSVAHALLKANICSNILLITGDTPSYVIHQNDVELLSIFGDSATATWISKSNKNEDIQFVFKTDGSGFDKLIVDRSGSRNKIDIKYLEETNLSYGIMKMDGTAIFLMSIKEVPSLIQQTLEKNKITLDEIDFVVFHQANSFMLEVLRKKLKIPIEKFFNDIQYTGNTVASSIPIALHQLINENKLKRNMKILLAGFGIGYTLGACVIEF
jgi:3-oxoacyl-[acyl-carrier-protein] synthase-3